MGAIGTNAVNVALYKTMPFDTLKDFAPITQVAEFPMLLVVHSSVKANSVKELIALAKAHPGELNAGNGGVGTSQHLATLLFESMTGTKFQGVSYKGFAAALSDMLSGNIQLTFGDMATLLPHLGSGKMRPLGVTSKDRSPILPNVPSIAEAGVPGYEAAAWYGLFAPAGTPKEIVDKIQKEVAAYIKTPAVVERFQKMGAQPVGSTPDQFRAHVISEKQRWGEAVAKAGLTASQ
jgi:tripartite-type tricarboxylate transporter receptor subunit TctC